MAAPGPDCGPRCDDSKVAGRRCCGEEGRACQRLLARRHCTHAKLWAASTSPALYFGQAGHGQRGRARTTLGEASKLCSVIVSSPGALPLSTQATSTDSMSTLAGAPEPT